MKKRKTLILCSSVVLLLLTGFIGFNVFQTNTAKFDSQRWKTDLKARYRMPLPLKPGMSKDKVLELLGEPDRKSDSCFVYWMPYSSNSDEGVYYVWFKKDLVDDSRFDDSGLRSVVIEDFKREVKSE